MNSKSILSFCAAFTFATLMLVSVNSNGILSTLDAFAANNCDSTSLCEEIDNSGSSTQNNNCRNLSLCSNLALGPDPNTQSNDCDRSFCTNLAISNTNQRINCVDATCNNFSFGFSNNQNMNCRATSCFNAGDGSDGTQNMVCANGGGCTNFDSGFSAPNKQNTLCQSSTCVNVGTNTNVQANSASETCSSGDPDTTTICQGDRVIFRPNN